MYMSYPTLRRTPYDNALLCSRAHAPTSGSNVESLWVDGVRRLAKRLLLRLRPNAHGAGRGRKHSHDRPGRHCKHSTMHDLDAA